jgi:Transglutaminase-like superfamily/Domain of Unknown Function with PDB structure (DUF3857)
LKYADIEIGLDPGESIKELRARTIHPDGSIVDFTGKPFEKTVNKGHGEKHVAKTFTLPDVTVGSIVEYSYLKVWLARRVFSVSAWPLQGELYTVKERFRFRPFLGYVRVATEWDKATGRSQAICSYSNQVGAPPAQKGKDGLMEIELSDVGVFLGEDYMPPQTVYKPEVICYYGGREFASADLFWPAWQQRISKFTEGWIGKPSGLHDEAAQTIGPETDPGKKLRKLYARVQKIRNLSFERERTAKEEKKEDLKQNESPRDVLQRGYGTHWEIDAAFAALARAAGFEASMIATSDRYRRSFSTMILWLGQFDGVAVVVTVGGKDLVLDPGTRFCPFGTLDWRHSAAPALSFKPGGTFVTTPDGQSSLSRRTAKLELTSDGSARGDITLEFDGQEALLRRLEALETDEAGKRKLLEDEILGWLPSGSRVKMVDSQGWDSTDDPLIVRLEVEAPLYASVAGKRMAAPVYLMPTPFKTVFTQSSRSYPIVFTFPFAEKDEVTLQLPPGYTLEAAPSARKAGLSYAAYAVSSSLQGNMLVTSRSLRLDKISFPPEKYMELQNVFNVVHAGDSAQVVLRAEPAKAGIQ